MIDDCCTDGPAAVEMNIILTLLYELLECRSFNPFILLFIIKLLGLYLSVLSII